MEAGRTVTRARRVKLDAPPWLLLIAEVVRRAPRLPGALCTGRPELFDGDDTAAREAAAALCRACPSLAACRQWVRSLPRSSRPPGVVAGPISGCVDMTQR
jgi:WhiB family redox-sensing transcriptional regulator